MNHSDEDELKKEFQLERMVFFSDAVFAIIITIMILDVKLPEALIHPTEAESKKAFLEIMPKLIGYSVSFCVVGALWLRHLKIFSFLKDYNSQLLVLNLIFLFSISLFPFALSFIFTSSYILQYTWGIYTYIGITQISLFTQSLLIGYMVRNKEELCLKTGGVEAKLLWKSRRIELFSFPVIIFLMIGSLYFYLSPYIVYGSFVVKGLLIKILRRRYYPDYKSDKVTLLSFFRNNTGLKHPVKKLH